MKKQWLPRWGSALLVFGFALGHAAFAQTPVITSGGTVNAADYTRNFAPGALISIFGSNLASTAGQAGQYPLPTTLGGASVQIAGTGQLLPLWYASPTQINAQLPYDVPTGSVQIRVTTPAGSSANDTITVAARAPKIFTLDFSGSGEAVATTTSYQVLSSSVPADPADTIVLWMNSMGATSATVTAGQPAPGLNGTTAATISGVTAKVNGIDAPVTFAGLSPGAVGLYQVNVQVPLFLVTGPATVQVTAGGVSTQTNVTIPYRQLGFYYTLLGGKAVPGQTLNGVSGSTSALAFRQADQGTWGAAGLNAWTNNTGLGSQYSTATGVALTLRNGATIVYDNNGIETGTTGGFYDNSNGGPNAQKPGLSDLYSMSNYFPLVFAGHFKLAQATTVTELIGYFDTLGNLATPFDPANGYIKYRMNVWSNASGTPKDTGSFAGDVFSSDRTAGTFSYSDTGARILSSVKTDAPKPIYRLSYKLAAPLTLPAGEYWFSNDASVRITPAAVSTTDANPNLITPELTAVTPPDEIPAISAGELQNWITSQGTVQQGQKKFSFFGREMTFENSYRIPSRVVVRPGAVVEHQ